MKFDELDARMRVFETVHDHHVLPGIYLVARLDGRGFTRLTKEVRPFEAPFDVAFRDLMVETVAHLMSSGFRAIYGYTESDEISLLFHPRIDLFARKVRKYVSILAGEASAKFSVLLGEVASFDCRISQLPQREYVVDYFRWRSGDALRNALNAHCYWILRKEGASAQEATRRLSGASVAEKNELLFERGINFNDLPAWQKRGVGLYWERYEKRGWNPVAQEETVAERRKLKVDLDLPARDAYDAFIEGLLDEAEGVTASGEIP